MVQSSSINCLLDCLQPNVSFTRLSTLSKVECSEEHLSNSSDDLGAPTCPGYSNHPALVVNSNGGAHGRHWPLARGDEVVGGGGHVVRRRDVRGCKVVHLVVQDDPRGGGHELATPDQVDRGGHRDCVAVW